MFRGSDISIPQSEMVFVPKARLHIGVHGWFLWRQSKRKLVVVVACLCVLSLSLCLFRCLPICLLLVCLSACLPVCLPPNFVHYRYVRMGIPLCVVLMPLSCHSTSSASPPSCTNVGALLIRIRLLGFLLNIIIVQYTPQTLV